ncbi:hypothetical protein Pmar_PMAR008639 [Perkinsus marinus ATCC 50983]|uniref:Uncharacterized protein n=1 Tax=Perkinsus marinus (strain ATCC 50983 / TXsc) TaxID=423536 RepID=C5KKX0_PERM5|nr:hypothetical protein Pmar_PMAR008639 [Perkinsus marinus ATCC 50983]EER14874.1 hypothetical protein Pmar_PMAR008639 [Perkinsus marinus ATCC 50983]|eukprot:XP_002783078.1 hypothetical protein Pmar_PMAR008639 [Perkinsus marinus ATCC 50983]
MSLIEQLIRCKRIYCMWITYCHYFVFFTSRVKQRSRTRFSSDGIHSTLTSN